MTTGPADASAEASRRELLTFSWSRLPFVTADVPGTGGVIRTRPEDFVVEELPLYLPEGAGSHLYLRVEKRGLTTRDLVLALVGAGVEEAAVGVAGLKDKHALTTQWLSLPKRHEEAAAALEELPGVRVLERAYHRNKLGLGHLRGNRFAVTVRGVADGAAAAAEAALAELARRGAPNWFGPQRFGRFGANAYDGWRVLRGEDVPGGHRLRRFFVSALQSLLFNEVLADRIGLGLYETLVAGDWARKHDTGGTFLVEDPEAEAPRAARLEVSATVPLYGRKVKPSPGRAGEVEAAAMERLGLRWADFTSRRGDRRLTRIVVAEPSVTADGDALTLRFTLPKGSYATSVLREVMKVDVDEPSTSGPAEETD
ncbi:MAG TPA: tRNA pseudouridine(13) synthase TruD [Trueperaceae bacterium]|nr:tRNA pseudouridine(13) synthase TruD [Trueperaceae bacterium]